VPDILPWSYPLQIVGRVVFLIAIYVVYLKSFLLAGYKMFRYQPMYISCGLFCVKAHSILQIAAFATGLYMRN
jgi:hypothetical protein